MNIVNSEGVKNITTFDFKRLIEKKEQSMSKADAIVIRTVHIWKLEIVRNVFIS